MLFEARERTRTVPMKPGEGEFAFYDSSGRSEFGIYRDLLNAWVAELPEADRAETVARFRKGDSLQYRAVLAELTIHAALIRQGYAVRLHPSCGHPTRRPDFEVLNAESKPIVIVEVTTFNPAADQVAQGNRDAAVFNALDKSTIPAGWRIGLDIVEHGKKPASLAKLCKAVELWAAEVAGNDPLATPAKTFEADDWSIEIMLYGGFNKEISAERMIATATGDARMIAPHQGIRQAAQLKGSRYGKMDLPYLIVIADCKDELRGGRIGDAALDAMFGSIVIAGWKDETGQSVFGEKRAADGYWGLPDAPRHPEVSGILVLPKPHLWDLRNERWQPILLRNPWAERPLPDNFLRLPGFEYVADQFSPTAGTMLADILGLPIPWPPEEA